MNDAPPFVSILIPVRNEERYIERCLYAISAQDYARARFEVLVVDGMSSDETVRIVSRFAAESTLDVRLLRNPAAKTAAGLNIGLAAARGDVIVRIDGHAAVSPDFLRRSVEALYSSGADCAGGVIASEGDTYTGEAIAAAMSSRFGVGGTAFRTGGSGYVDTVAFGAYRREVFDRIGVFAEDIDKGEDDEFNYRLLDSGGRIFLDPSIRTHYTVRGSFGELWRQYFGYGRAKVEVLRRHPRQARVRQAVPAVFVAALLTSTVAAPRACRSLVLAYGGYVAGASIVLAARRSWRVLPALPPALACLHLSYGLGFLSGAASLAGRLVRARVAEAPASSEARAES